MDFKKNLFVGIICRIERDGINPRKFVAAQILFLSDAHVTVAIVVA